MFENCKLCDHVTFLREVVQDKTHFGLGEAGFVWSVRGKFKTQKVLRNG